MGPKHRPRRKNMRPSMTRASRASPKAVLARGDAVLPPARPAGRVPIRNAQDSSTYCCTETLGNDPIQTSGRVEEALDGAHSKSQRFLPRRASVGHGALQILEAWAASSLHRCHCDRHCIPHVSFGMLVPPPFLLSDAFLLVLPCVFTFFLGGPGQVRFSFPCAEGKHVFPSLLDPCGWIGMGPSCPIPPSPSPFAFPFPIGTSTVCCPMDRRGSRFKKPRERGDLISDRTEPKRSRSDGRRGRRGVPARSGRRVRFRKDVDLEGEGRRRDPIGAARIRLGWRDGERCGTVVPNTQGLVGNRAYRRWDRNARHATRESNGPGREREETWKESMVELRQRTGRRSTTRRHQNRTNDLRSQRKHPRWTRRTNRAFVLATSHRNLQHVRRIGRGTARPAHPPHLLLHPVTCASQNTQDEAIVGRGR